MREDVGTAMTTNAELNKKVNELERQVKAGQFVNVCVLEKPAERWMRCLYMGVSPDNPNYYVVYNANFGVKEFERSKVKR